MEVYGEEESEASLSPRPRLGFCQSVWIFLSERKSVVLTKDKVVIAKYLPKNLIMPCVLHQQ
jgi:hypothetical protein